MFCTTQQFIDLKGGDAEEHAIALRNYFAYIDDAQEETKNIKSYLLFGDAVPEGKTCFVLRQKYDAATKKVIESEIWNP